MKTCYDGVLALPGNHALMDEEEMCYVEGGVSLAMKSSYLSKSTCKSTASKYTRSTGMSQMRIAKEIYAHAVMYYASPVALGGYAATISAFNPLFSAGALAALYYIRSHANPVDLGGDSAFRVNIYNAIWAVL